MHWRFVAKKYVFDIVSFQSCFALFNVISRWKGGKKAISEHAAVWVPDAEAAVCMHCKKTQFTVLNRRVSMVFTIASHDINLHAYFSMWIYITEFGFHWVFLFTISLTFDLQHHCRKCGAVVCGPCSNKRYLLPNQSSKPLRVCLNCYDELSLQKAQQISNSNSFKNSKCTIVLILQWIYRDKSLLSCIKQSNEN